MSKICMRSSTLCEQSEQIKLHRKSYGQIVDDYLLSTQLLHERSTTIETLQQQLQQQQQQQHTYLRSTSAQSSVASSPTSKHTSSTFNTAHTHSSNNTPSSTPVTQPCPTTSHLPSQTSDSIHVPDTERHSDTASSEDANSHQHATSGMSGLSLHAAPLPAQTNSNLLSQPGPASSTDPSHAHSRLPAHQPGVREGESDSQTPPSAYFKQASGLSTGPESFRDSTPPSTHARRDQQASDSRRGRPFPASTMPPPQHQQQQLQQPQAIDSSSSSRAHLLSEYGTAAAAAAARTASNDPRGPVGAPVGAVHASIRAMSLLYRDFAPLAALPDAPAPLPHPERTDATAPLPNRNAGTDVKGAAPDPAPARDFAAPSRYPDWTPGIQSVPSGPPKVDAVQAALPGSHVYSYSSSQDAHPTLSSLGSLPVTSTQPQLLPSLTHANATGPLPARQAHGVTPSRSLSSAMPSDVGGGQAPLARTGRRFSDHEAEAVPAGAAAAVAVEGSRLPARPPVPGSREAGLHPGQAAAPHVTSSLMQQAGSLASSTRPSTAQTQSPSVTLPVLRRSGSGPERPRPTPAGGSTAAAAAASAAAGFEYDAVAGALVAPYAATLDVPLRPAVGGVGSMCSWPGTSVPNASQRAGPMSDDSTSGRSTSSSSFEAYMDKCAGENVVEQRGEEEDGEDGHNAALRMLNSSLQTDYASVGLPTSFDDSSDSDGGEGLTPAVKPNASGGDLDGFGESSADEDEEVPSDDGGDDEVITDSRPVRSVPGQTPLHTLGVDQRYRWHQLSTHAGQGASHLQVRSVQQQQQDPPQMEPPVINRPAPAAQNDSSRRQSSPGTVADRPWRRSVSGSSGSGSSGSGVSDTLPVHPPSQPPPPMASCTAAARLDPRARPPKPPGSSCSLRRQGATRSVGAE
ncbi:MAG: hypothetical protein WDW36_001877 [Sanguina aurantia]